MVALPRWARTVLRRREEKVDDKRGRCFHCGFLCKVRSEQDFPMAFYSIDYIEREDGAAWEHTEESGTKRDTMPWCFRSSEDFADEVAGILGGIGERQDDIAKKPSGQDTMLAMHGVREWEKVAARSVFEKDRGCSEWIEFVPGLDLVTHLGGKAMQDTERRARGMVKLQIGLAVGQLALAGLAVVVAVILARTFTSGGDTNNFYFTEPTVVASEAIAAPLPSDTVALTPTPSPEPAPDTASPQP